MPNFTHRSGDVEVMDDLDCGGPVLQQTLRELEIVNKWLGGNTITIQALEQLLQSHDKKSEISIVDLGCGGGDMLRIIAKWGARNNFKFKLTGIDANPNVIAFARRNVPEFSPETFQTVNIFSKEFSSRQYDVVVGTLFFHHFVDADLIDFFKQLKTQVRLGLIINDLHRHAFAYYSIKMLTGLFSRSPMVKYDAPLSVLRGFSRKELAFVLQAAGLTEYDLTWRWAFRWQVIAPSQ